MIDAATFIESTLVNPETGDYFVLTDVERAFLRYAFELTPDGRLAHPELLFSAPKKSGKTGFAAMILIYVVVALGGPFAEGIVAANDYEQARSRVFEAAARIAKPSPLLPHPPSIKPPQITFPPTSATTPPT